MHKARGIPLAKSYFVDAVKKVRESTKKPIVFYCNGITCKKSYKATKKAQENGVSNVFSFDLGIPAWSVAHPDKTVLLGKFPADPAKMVSNADFNAKLLSPANFVKKLSREMILIDVRDTFQKKDANILNNRAISITLSEPSKIFQLGKQGKTLMIFDAVGKQVRWLQYHLRSANVKDYYFMKGGVRAYQEANL